MSDDSWAMQYIRSASEAPLLERDEEDNLASRARSGDGAAQTELVASSRRLVIAIAKRHELPRGQSLADVLKVGDNGLRLAVDRFDPAKGVHFHDVAVWWVRRAIGDQIGRDPPT
jgi:RNA polymerase primary sigma factor